MTTETPVATTPMTATAATPDPKADPKALTPRQAEVLAFMLDFKRKNHMPPTVRDIGESLGIKSTNGVTCHLKALEKKNCIQRVGKKARGIVIVDPDEPRMSVPVSGALTARGVSAVTATAIDMLPLLRPGTACYRVSSVADGLAPGDMIFVASQSAYDKKDPVLWADKLGFGLLAFHQLTGQKLLGKVLGVLRTTSK